MLLGINSRMAFETVREHKTRSLLTVLGVVIGVAAMIFVASMLVGVSRDIEGYLDDYGTNTLFVFRWDFAIRVGRMSQEERNRKPLTLEDAKAIVDECPHVKSVTVEVMPRINPDEQRPPLRVARYGTHEITNLDYTGTDTSYQDVYNAHVAQGRFFTDFEDQHHEGVAVIGYEIDKNFFPAHDGVGKTILVDGQSYKVVGVLEKRKGQLFKDESADRTVKVPYHAYHKNYPADDEYFIGAEAYPGFKDAAEDEIRGLLRRREWLVFENTLPERFRPRKITRIPATFIGFHGCRDASTRVTWLAIYPSGAIETECNGAGWFQLSNKAGAKAGYEEAEGAYTTYCDDKPENAQIEKLETRVAELEKSQSMLTRRVENLAIALATLLPKPAQNPDPKDKMVTDS